MAAAPDPGTHLHPVAVIIDEDAHRQLVADLGPSGAAALVTVALKARQDTPGRLTAEVSARSLARELHVAKDTAAGALSLLVRRGYLARQAQPRVAGRFAPASYRLRLPRGLVVTTDPAVVPCPTRPDTAAGGEAPVPAPATSSRRARPVGSPSGRDQLGLFAGDGEGSRS